MQRMTMCRSLTDTLASALRSYFASKAVFLPMRCAINTTSFAVTWPSPLRSARPQPVPGVAVAAGVFVAGTGVFVGGTGVFVGGTGVFVGGTGVFVGGTGVFVGGTGVLV